ncbi:hypothetical protein [Streptomyces lydicus]|uniref:hypothetical protein n=1 Tax=Streptomyces lydicus TaxID=47763 RepID=UPI0013DDDD40
MRHLPWHRAADLGPVRRGLATRAAHALRGHPAEQVLALQSRRYGLAGSPGFLGGMGSRIRQPTAYFLPEPARAFRDSRAHEPGHGCILEILAPGDLLPGDYAALRNLFHRMLGQLHHCLASRQKFDEAIAFAPPKPAPLAAAS